MQKKIPQRMCLACQERKDKKSLVRIVRSPEGEISIDRTGKKAGRGAYMCPNEVCLEKLRKSKRLASSLETEISDDIYDQLKAALR